MRQEIYHDRFRMAEWSTEHSRSFVHILNSRSWQNVTGEAPPHQPMSAADYVKAGLPWFDHYDDRVTPLKATDTLSGLKSVAEIKAKNPSLESPEELPVVKVGPSKRRRPVHDGDF